MADGLLKHGTAKHSDAGAAAPPVVFVHGEHRCCPARPRRRPLRPNLLLDLTSPSGEQDLAAGDPKTAQHRRPTFAADAPRCSPTGSTPLRASPSLCSAGSSTRSRSSPAAAALASPASAPPPLP